MQLLENYYTSNYENFNEWFNLIKKDEEVYPRFRIPYKDWLSEYIESIEDKTEDDVKELLRYLLHPFTRALDQLTYDTLYAHKKSLIISSEKNHEKKYFGNSMNMEMYKRIENGQSAWEGLTWVLQLLPSHPYKAINALKSYLQAEIVNMPDDRIIGIEQCMAIIEAKFISANKGLENSITKLTPREFEWVIEILYKNIGYETLLTPVTRDGGKDIIARIDREDGRETVYIECKLYKTTALTIESVRAFGYKIFKDNINRGVLFCTGYVNENLKNLDPRIQIWTLDEIIILLNAHIGTNWNERLKLLIENQRRKYKK